MLHSPYQIRTHIQKGKHMIFHLPQKVSGEKLLKAIIKAASESESAKHRVGVDTEMGTEMLLTISRPVVVNVILNLGIESLKREYLILGKEVWTPFHFYHTAQTQPINPSKRYDTLELTHYNWFGQYNCVEKFLANLYQELKPEPKMTTRRQKVSRRK